MRGKWAVQFPFLTDGHNLKVLWGRPAWAAINSCGLPRALVRELMSVKPKAVAVVLRDGKVSQIYLEKVPHQIKALERANIRSEFYGNCLCLEVTK